MVQESSSAMLLCQYKILGYSDVKVDDECNITFVGNVSSPSFTLLNGTKGIRGTGLSGLPIKILKLNKCFEHLEITGLSNCNSLREIHVYEHQLDLVKELKELYPSLTIVLRKGVV